MKMPPKTAIAIGLKGIIGQQLAIGFVIPCKKGLKNGYKKAKCNRLY